MSKQLDRILEKYEYPIVNSLTFANGEMLVLHSCFIGEEYKINVLCKSTFESYFEYNSKDSVSSFSVPTCVENLNYSVYAGEGSWGGDGVVFIVDKNSNQLVWFLFLENSNPFEEIHFETSEIITVGSTSNVKLRIPIKKPWEIAAI